MYMYFDLYHVFCVVIIGRSELSLNLAGEKAIARLLERAVSSRSR